MANQSQFPFCCGGKIKIKIHKKVLNENILLNLIQQKIKRKKKKQKTKTKDLQFGEKAEKGSKSVKAESPF